MFFRRNDCGTSIVSVSFVLLSNFLYPYVFLTMYSRYLCYRVQDINGRVRSTLNRNYPQQENELNKQRIINTLADRNLALTIRGAPTYQVSYDMILQLMRPEVEGLAGNQERHVLQLAHDICQEIRQDRSSLPSFLFLPSFPHSLPSHSACPLFLRSTSLFPIPPFDCSLSILFILIICPPLPLLTHFIWLNHSAVLFA